MKIDPRKLFPNGLDGSYDGNYVSQLLLARDEVPEVLDALQDLGIVWATGINPTDFYPTTDEPDSPYFCLEFFMHAGDGSIRFSYEDYDVMPTGDHSSNRFWIEEVLSDELIRPTPLNLELLLDTEVFR